MMKRANRVFVLMHLRDGREYLGNPTYIVGDDKIKG
jgi:hypothetical protein